MPTLTPTNSDHSSTWELDVPPAHQADLIDQIAQASASRQSPPRPHGMVVGRFMGLDSQQRPRVVVEQVGILVIDHSLIPLDDEHLGRQVVVQLPATPSAQTPSIVMGLIWQASGAAASDDAPEHRVIEAQTQLEFRCGDSAIILNADGRIQLRGHYITSQASATQRILGGSVQVN